jgi:3',5'-cyclic AMP phosphodiesterase CpdA
MPERLRFAILADAHVLSDGAPPLHGIDSTGNLRTAIERVRGLIPAAAFVVHLGDLVGEETPQAYGAFTAITSALNLPQYPVLGNHDDPELLAEALPVPEGVDPAGAPDGHYSFTRGPLHIVVLNSRIAGEIGGRLDATQLDWLDDDLHTHHDTTTLVFVHHPPASIGIEWLDASRLSNAAGLAAVIKRSGSVAMVFAGHVHRHERATSGGLSVETAPSTWTSFQANPDEPRLDTGQGFLVVDAGSRRLSVRRVVL